MRALTERLSDTSSTLGEISDKFLKEQKHYLSTATNIIPTRKALAITSALFASTSANSWTITDDNEHPTEYRDEKLADPHQLLSDAGQWISIAYPGGITPALGKFKIESQWQSRTHLVLPICHIKDKS